MLWGVITLKDKSYNQEVREGGDDFESSTREFVAIYIIKMDLVNTNPYCTSTTAK